MAYDGITTFHIVQELKSKCLGGRIRKIYQPENDEIRLVVNPGRETFHLLISANANNPRVYLTANPKVNPNQAPGFCMVLRKHLLNGTILDITQYLSDRLIEIHIGTKNDFGDTVVRSLICEIMGRNANIILNDRPLGAEGEPIIMDSLKKVGISSSRYRQILPGKTYVAPPENGRLDFLQINEEKLDALMKDHLQLSLEKMLVQKCLGVSPLLAEEICFRAGISENLSPSDLTVKQKGWVIKSTLNIKNEILAGPFPVHYCHNRDVIAFSTLSLHRLSELRAQSFPTISEMLEDYYFQKDRKIRFNTKSANLKHQLSNLYKKSAKKLQNLKQDMAQSEKDEASKLYGDLITANIWQIEKGMESIDLPNYMDADYTLVHVPLKVNETPAQNAQRYYKKYNKAKRAQIQLEEQIDLCEEQTYYLDSLLNALEQCSEPNELDEIRYEFNHSEFVKQKNNQKDKRPVASSPLHYRSSEGFDIYVGKNNYQNDAISTRMGVAEDCWLHVKDIPGSHVLIVANGQFITEKTVLEGGMLAAWHSKARGSENVPVDYVEFKYVHKPSKAKPGMVTFTNQNTMYITPKRESVLKIELLET